MIGVITDIIQSTAILMWAAMMIFLVRRVRRLDTRLDLKRITADWEKANRERQESLNPQAICGCQHHQCFHDDNGCGGNVIHTYYDRNEMTREAVTCGCKRYSGPEQLPTVIP